MWRTSQVKESPNFSFRCACTRRAWSSRFAAELMVNMSERLITLKFLAIELSECDPGNTSKIGPPRLYLKGSLLEQSRTTMGETA
jgi:hypothetical protein